MPDPRFFAWIDLECTGKNKQEDYIIEFGMIITEVAFPCRELERYEAVILPSDPAWSDHMDAFVRKMHTANGLIRDVELRGRPIGEVENEILSIFMRYGRAHSFMLAGSAVSHYDHQFLAREMPKVNRWLQHPSLDVGTIRRALRFSGRKDLDAFGQTFDGVDKPHRGLADVADHLNEYRQYASMFQMIPKEG